jgi:hypothetical protein
MTMKLIKKTDDYSIFQRGDERYAVKDAAKNAVNGEDKVKILLAEGLIKVTEPATPAEPEAEEATEEASADTGEEAAEASSDEASE